MSHGKPPTPTSDYETAKRTCAVRSAIRRRAEPERLYWKNNSVSLDDRISAYDKRQTDWEEYDPREQEDCSAFQETPA